MKRPAFAWQDNTQNRCKGLLEFFDLYQTQN
jgi:hypothetical protein